MNETPAPPDNWDDLADAAHQLGVERASAIQASMQAEDASLADAPSPLSGEWAGDPTTTSLMRDLGLDPHETNPDMIDHLCNSYEDGYWGHLRTQEDEKTQTKPTTLLGAHVSRCIREGSEIVRERCIHPIFGPSEQALMRDATASLARYADTL